MKLEVAGPECANQQGASSEFTSNASLRQLLCLLPSDQTDSAAKGEESSDDSIDRQALKRQGNLELSKSFSAFIRVAKQATEINAKPQAAHIIRQSKKQKPTRK